MKSKMEPFKVSSCQVGMGNESPFVFSVDDL